MKRFSGFSAAAAIGLSLAFTAPALAQGVGENFSIDEGVIGGGTMPNVVSDIDRITFVYSATIDQSNDGGLLNGDAFHEKGFAHWTGYIPDSGAPLSSQLSAVGAADYEVYMVFEATGTAAVTGTGITATFTTFTIDIYLDVDSNTTLALPTDTTAGDGTIDGDVQIAGNGEDQLLATATLLSTGEAHLFDGLANGDFEIVVSDLFLKMFGEDFFSDPVPFYTVMNFRGNTGSVTPPGSATAPFRAVAEGDGSLFFTIPEPGTLGLLGAGLMGAAAFLRRRKSAKAA